MIRSASLGAIGVLLTLLASGCGGDRRSDDALVGGPGIAPPAEIETVRQGTVAISPGPSLDDPLGPDDAVAVLEAYYAAIRERDYETAHQLWADGGLMSGQTREEFERGFARTRTAEVIPGTPDRIEPAAGSRYIRIPVEVHAALVDDEEQCYRGSYTLVYSVVPGATEAQRSWRIYSAELEPCSVAPPDSARDGSARAVRALVTEFGERLERVSLLAPAESARNAIRREYALLLTDSLLAAWLERPEEAVGREVSSPWPDRIEISDVDQIRPDAYSVEGNIILVSSADLAGHEEPAGREPVRILVRRVDGDWRISSVLRE